MRDVGRRPGRRPGAPRRRTGAGPRASRGARRCDRDPASATRDRRRRSVPAPTRHRRRRPRAGVHGHLDAAVRQVRHEGQRRRRTAAGTASSQTVCQIPDCAVYQMPPRCSRCLPARAGPRRVEVADVDHELVVARPQRGGDVARERQVAARVGADLDAVEPDGAGLVDGAEVQQHPAVHGAEPVRQPKRAAVPEPLVGLQLPADPRQRRLGGERDEDRVRRTAWAERSAAGVMA